jgi:hypothetical protein
VTRRSPRSRLALPASLALVLLGAGCGDRFGFRHYEPDAVPGPESAAVLDSYGDRPPASEPDDLRLADDLRRGLPGARPGHPPLESPPPSDVRLPGGVERPWAEPPHTDPAAWQAGVQPDSPSAADGSAGTSAGGRGLAAGGTVAVAVERHPEFSGLWALDRAGLLTIPTGGAFGPGLLVPEEFSRRIGRSAGLSPEELAARIARELQPSLTKPAEVSVVPGPQRERRP